MVRVTVILDDELIKKIQQIAKDEERSKSSMVRVLLREGLEIYRKSKEV